MTDVVDHDLLDALRADPNLAGQIVSVQTLPSQSGVFETPESSMHARLREGLSAAGIERLYSHQARAFDAASRGEDVVVVTGTNSGKTLCYNLPALQLCLSEPICRALYLFPTKALAQDQLGKLTALASSDVRCAVYDGDTPKSQRGAIRKAAHIVLSNPDMLHTGILPSHENWGKFLKSLRLIVLDEMHVYRGVFGSHVGGVLRRLLRLCEWRNNRPQIIGCSATIGNPRDLFKKLTGRTCTLIDADGAARARRTFVFWNPPRLADETRVSSNVISSEVLATLCEANLRTIAFCRARVTAELLLRYTRDRLEKGGRIDPKRVESYRAGYTPKERRQIEKGLFEGKLLGLAATDAMELGVDVGGLDAALLNGYPGTISSFWQQSGRAGRGSRPGLTVMVAQADPLDQFLIHEPHRIMEASSDQVALNPFNKQILAQELRCAAFERPIAPTELEMFGPTAVEVAESLDRAGELAFSAGSFVYPYDGESPAHKVNIRGSSGEEVVLVHDGVELGTMERWRAMQAAHEGAVYLHRGNSYLVESLDLNAGQAIVSSRTLPYFTQALSQSTIDPQVEISIKPWGRLEARLQGVKVTDLVVGYKQIALSDRRVLGVFPLEMPASSYDTVGIRLDLPMSIEGEEDMTYVAALHGLEHALMAIAPLLAGCDRGDLGSAWYSVFPGTLAPALFVFDRTPGGVGLCEELYKSLAGWALAALQMLSSCSCLDGCPGCLLSARCEANNELLDKQGAIRLLRDLTSQG